jgi:hypothetical protein
LNQKTVLLAHQWVQTLRRRLFLRGQDSHHRLSQRQQPTPKMTNPPKKVNKRGEFVTLPDGRKLSWSEYREWLRNNHPISDEQMKQWKDGQGIVPKEKP